MSPKTPRGQTRTKVYKFVRERILAGQPPTVREVQTEFSFRSVQSAREHLENLVKEGRLVKNSGVSRGYRLPDEMSLEPQRAVPLLGAVQAGVMMEAIEAPDGYVGVQYSGATDVLFALKVRGYSMQNAGILPGDIVIVKKQVSANEGDIVVAMIDGEATVKRLRYEGGIPVLFPENDDFSPIVPGEGDEMVLLGRVIEIRRYLDA